MGAVYTTKSFPASASKQLQKDFSDYQESCTNKYGSDTYSGHMGLARGLVISNKEFKDKSSAIDWLENNVQKWESAKAVKVGDFSKSFPKTIAEKNLLIKYEEVKSRLSNWDTTILSRTKKGKSLLKGCDKCGSKIALKFLQTNNCPVCGNSNYLETDTDKKQKATLSKSFKDLHTKIELAKSKNKNAACWMVGACVPE